MIMPISFIPYPLPKPSQWLTLTPWFSKSPPSPPPSPPSSSSPKSKPSSASMPSRPSPPVVILLPSPVTTTATSIKTPEMTQVRKHTMVVGGTLISPSSDKAQVAQSSGDSDGREDKSNINEMTLTSTKAKMKNRLEAVTEKPLRFVQPKSLKQDDVVWLFDLRSARGAVPWHPNTWKIRLALNYKKIPYTTVWLTYPSMEPVLKQLGVPPMQRNRTGKVHYSVPVIVDWRVPSTSSKGGGGQHQGELWAVSGSERILDYLDGLYTATPTTTATTTTYTSRSRKSKSQSPPPSSVALASTSRSQSHPPSSSRHTDYHSYFSPTSASSSSSLARRPKLLQSMFDSMVERVLDPPFWKMILPLAWIGGVLDEESKAYFLEVRGCPSGLVADNIDNAQTNTTARTKRWNPERYVTSRDWDALREGFETIAAFCEMYGIGIGIGGVAKGKDSSSPGEEQAREREREQNLDPDSDELMLTRVEIVLIAYLAALHECVPAEKWAEVRDMWCSGTWGVLWDRSARVRVNAECS